MKCPNCESMAVEVRNPLKALAGGAAAGAVAGSVVPVLGTAAGALFGGLGTLLASTYTRHKYFCRGCKYAWGAQNDPDA